MRHHHHHKPLRVVFEAALEHGDLSAVQAATVREIQADLRSDREERRARREKLRAAAVEVVRSGTADSKQFEQAVQKATAAIEERMQAHSDALIELHAILDVDQREGVADALRARLEKRFGERRAKKHRHRKGLERIVAYLMLSQLQIDELRAMHRELMGPEKRLRPTREELESLVTAFEGDQFEAALESFQKGKVALLNEHIARAGEHTDTVLAILDAGQRALLADLIERGPRGVLLAEQR
ncbi:MAG: hypothetical protein JRI23_23845 [Deltaproteobacteria bacterium]|nr:hypothetical protein [Deltaproteobacteria bacterium]MBW2535025.1 hypothetical protein [Deltaproteobacteria bacterium]